MTLLSARLFSATRSIVAFGALLSLFCGSTALADTVGTIRFNDLFGAPASVTLTGVTGASSICTPSGIAPPTTLETCTVTLLPPNGPSGVFYSQWDIYDADGSLSDTIAVNNFINPVTFATTSATITFSSCEPGALCGLTALGGNRVLEDGTVQTVGQFAWLYGNGANVVDTIQFQSNDAPEPSTTTLMGVGLIGLGMFVRRHRKVA